MTRGIDFLFSTFICCFMTFCIGELNLYLVRSGHLEFSFIMITVQPFRISFYPHFCVNPLQSCRGIVIVWVCRRHAACSIQQHLVNSITLHKLPYHVVILSGCSPHQTLRCVWYRPFWTFKLAHGQTSLWTR